MCRGWKEKRQTLYLKPKIASLSTRDIKKPSTKTEIKKINTKIKRADRRYSHYSHTQLSFCICFHSWKKSLKGTLLTASWFKADGLLNSSWKGLSYKEGLNSCPRYSNFLRSTEMRSALSFTELLDRST